MADNALTAQTRTEFGKGAARRARRAGLIPAVVYGHGVDPIHVDLPGHELFLIVRGTPNAVIELTLDGKSQLALVKDIQRHPVSRVLLHADLLAIKKGEKVDVDVPLVTTGEPAPKTVVNAEEFTIAVKAPATSIPEAIEFDVTDLEVGTVITVADLKMPKGVEVQFEEDRVVLSVQEVIEQAEEPAEAEGDAAEEAATEE